MVPMYPSRGLTTFALASVLLCVGYVAAAQPASPLESLALAPQDTCSAAKRREQQLNAEVSQQPNTLIVSAKRAFRGDPAQLIYFCQVNDRVIRRHIFMRFTDATIAEASLNRQVSALIEELGQPCAAIVEPPADSPDYSSNNTSGLRRTIVWNISADYNAIVLFFPATSSDPWQVQLVFNSLAATSLSEKSQDIWRAHGCVLPNPKQHDPKTGAATLIIP
jgi:hypothetical protein